MKYFGCLIGRDEKQSTGISNYYKNLSAVTIFNAREKLALLIFPKYIWISWIRRISISVR